MTQRGQTNKLTISPWEEAPPVSPAKQADCHTGSAVLDPDYTRANPIESRKAIEIVVADDTEMGTQLLADSLRRHHRFQVIAATRDWVEAAASGCDLNPQVALISSSLDQDSLNGLELSRRLRSNHPEIKVIVLLNRPTRESVVEAFRAGAQGVFCRTGSLKALRKCILCVHAGQIWANSREMSYLLEALCENRVRPLLDAKGARLLSKREEDVLNCAVDGLKNREIAAQLHLSEHTIKNYMFRIFDKLGVSSRVEMILYALSQRSTSSSVESDAW